MGKKTEAEYQKWIEEVKGKLPDDTLKAAFDTITGHEVGKEVFGGYQREADYYRRLNDVAAEKSQLEKEKQSWSKWFEEESPKNQVLIAERDTLAKQVSALKAAVMGEEPNTMPTNFASPTPPNGGSADTAALRAEIDVLREQLKVLPVIDKALPRLMADAMDLTYKITSEKWKVSPKQVLDHALTRGTDITSAFNELTSEERETRSKEDLAKQIKEAEDRGRRDALKARTPDQLTMNGPSILDNIRAKAPVDARARVADAVSAYVDLPADSKL